MATTGQMLAKFQALNLDEEVTEIILINKEDYLDQNREQLLAGYDADGLRLPPYRSPSYALYKSSLNAEPGTGNPDYHLTGAMFAAMQLTIAGNEIIITSGVDYTPDLLARGGQPFGLNKTGKGNFISLVLYDELLRVIKDKTGTI